MSIFRDVGSVIPATVSAGSFLGFLLDTSARTITPWTYNSDGTPGAALTPVSISGGGAIGSSSIVAGWIKRNLPTSLVCLSSIAVTGTYGIFLSYDYVTDTWSSEVSRVPPGYSALAGGDTGVSVENTGDDYLYVLTRCTPGPITVVLRRLSPDLVTTDVVVASAVASIGLCGVYQLAAQTLGAYTDAIGVEIDFDGTVRNPTAYDQDYSFEDYDWSSYSELFGEALAKRLTGEVDRMTVSGADLSRDVRVQPVSSYLGGRPVMGETAMGAYPAAIESSPPSQTFDWIESLPKSALSASAVLIRPTDYVDAGSPGTVGALPDSVIPLDAAP